MVGSLHLNALEHTPSAPKGKRLGQRACIGRVAQGQRGGGMRVFEVFESWAGKCVFERPAVILTSPPHLGGWI